MLQTGTISGVVRDALGAPLGNAEVQAFKATYQTGRRVLMGFPFSSLLFSEGLSRYSFATRSSSGFGSRAKAMR